MITSHKRSQLTEPISADSCQTTIVYFKKNWNITSEQLKLLENEINCNIINCHDQRELNNALLSKTQLFVFHPNILDDTQITLSEFVNVLEVQAKLKCIILPRIAVTIDKQHSSKFIKLLQKENIQGIIPCPTGFSTSETITAIKSLLLDFAYWPKHIISQLSDQQCDLTHPHQLTNRQQQVMHLICNRGLSNKKIASTLHITESTVKIHVSAILKHLGVRNRTQLVLAASSSLKA